MKELLAIDLFSGCGGLTEGLKQAGFRVIAGAEIRPEAREAYTLNHAKVHLFEDVRHINFEAIQKVQTLELGRLDLLAACPPCQGFSTLRTNNHLKPAKDARNKLIYQVARIAEELLPRAILVENVPGLLKDGRLAKFQTRLRKLGYKTTKGVLDAAEFGVPQRRRRMIFIAILGDSKPPLPAPDDRAKTTVRAAIGNLVKSDDALAPPLHRIKQQLSAKVLDRVKQTPKDGGSRRHLGKDAQLPCHQRQTGFNDVYGRLAWDKVSVTITRSCHNPSKGRYLHPEENRGLTLHEAMLLQGFPDDYKLHVSGGIGKIASLIGEAFPPPFATAQARHIRTLLEQR